MSNNPTQGSMQSIAKAIIGFSGLIVGVACSIIGQESRVPPKEDDTHTSIEEVANQMAAEYGQQQMQRLAKKNDRDSLIAAALVGSPNDAKVDAAQGHAELLQRLASEYSTDPLAIYTAALICNVQSKPCAHTEYQSQLLRLEPTNAVHFLVVARGEKISTAQLHLAASATEADTHFSELLGIVRSALADQPAQNLPTQQRRTQSFNWNELALALRRNEIASVPWPNYGPATEICNAEAAASRDHQLHANCSSLGKILFSDASENIVTRMVGGSMIRRFGKGTQAEAEAKAFRRQYVWMNEQLPEDATSEEKEKLNEEEVALGEWEAYQRDAERAGVQRIPPADWVPSNPEALLLPEERTAKPANK